MNSGVDEVEEGGREGRVVWLVEGEGGGCMGDKGCAEAKRGCPRGLFGGVLRGTS